MDVFLLDSAFKKASIIEGYSSLIWTDRYADAGDFKMTISWSPENAAKLVKGARLYKPGMIIQILANFEVDEVGTVMTIETIEIQDTRETGPVMTISGPSLKKFMDHRAIGKALTVAGMSFDNGGLLNPAETINQMVDNAFVAHVHDAKDAVVIENDGMIDDGLFAGDEPLDYDMTIKPGSLYTRVKELCDSYNLGFDIVCANDRIAGAWVAFVLYAGTVRDIAFGPDLDTLINTKELHSIANLKNVAYVIGKDKVVKVFTGATEATGWDRRVLIVEASDVAGTTTSATTKLKNRGLTELQKSVETNAFDGTITDVSPYKFGEDYFLGDVIEIHSSTGMVQQMRVTEYITSQDASGDRAYPTLTAI